MAYERCPLHAGPGLWGGCFRCAVDFVIARFGGDPNCECRRPGSPGFCEECVARSFDWNQRGDSPLGDFQRATPPYHGLASLYAGLAGSYQAALENGVILLGRNRNQAVLELIDAAKTDPFAHDAALYFVAESIRYDVKVPKAIREWAFFAITGAIPRPPQKGKYPPALTGRDAAIVGLVREVSAHYKLHATSSDEIGGQSACHAVAEGLRLLRLQPDSYSAIRRIWRNRPKARTAAP